MRLETCLVLACMMCGIAWSGVAFGDEPSWPALASGALPAGSEDTLLRADKARRAGRWQEAAAAYRAAWEATGRPELAGALGLCELSLRRFRDAAEHLRLGLSAHEALAPVQRSRFEHGLRQAAREVATVSLVVGRPEAEVFVDDKPVGRGLATYVVYVEPGWHEARAKLAGHADGTGRFEALRGETAAVGLALKAKPAPPSKPVPAPLPRPPAAAPPPPAPPRSWPVTALRVGALGLASVGFATGVGFTVASNDKDDEAEARAGALRKAGGPPACHEGIALDGCDALNAALGAREELEAAAIAGFVIGGVIGAAAVSSFWWAPGPSGTGVLVLPRATAQGGGVIVRGAW
jgi:hypothetical protein